MKCKACGSEKCKCKPEAPKSKGGKGEKKPAPFPPKKPAKK